MFSVDLPDSDFRGRGLERRSGPETGSESASGTIFDRSVPICMILYLHRRSVQWRWMAREEWGGGRVEDEATGFNGVEKGWARGRGRKREIGARRETPWKQENMGVSLRVNNEIINRKPDQYRMEITSVQTHPGTVIVARQPLRWIT